MLANMQIKAGLSQNTASHIKRRPEQFIAGKSFRVNWFIPVYDEDVLTGKAIITRLVERNLYNGIVEIRIVIHNQKDELVMDTYTEAIIARHSAAERLAGSVN